MTSGKSENLTDEQNDLCFEIQFEIIRAIINMNHDVMWDLIQRAIESGKGNE